MTDVFKRFESNLISVRAINHIYAYLSKGNVESIDLTELLRAEYVLLVSAFDSLIHDIVKSGIIEIFENPQSDKSIQNFQISLEITKQLINVESKDERSRLLSVEIRKITSKDSYQSPSSIENALQLLSINKIWSKISDDCGLKAEDIRKQLGLIVNRRNKIAHEADWNPATGEKTSLQKEDLDDAHSFIRTITSSLLNIMKQELTNA